MRRRRAPGWSWQRGPRSRPGRIATRSLSSAAHSSSGLVTPTSRAGWFSAALEVIAAGLDAAAGAGREDLVRRLRALEGNVRARAGDGDAGLRIVRAALSDALTHGDHGSAAEAYQRLADSLEHAGDYRAARASYSEAAEFCELNGAGTLGEVCLACL